MKKLHALLDKHVRPFFAKGGRLHGLYPVYEALDSFHFVLPKRTEAGCHLRDSLDTKRLMSMVIVALIPPLFFGTWNVGYQYYLARGGQAGVEAAGFLSCFLVGMRYVAPLILVSYISGGIVEVLFATIRKHEINEGFLVTGMLVPLIVPPTTPLWVLAIGVAAGVLLGKEVWGGTGMNVFNPALVCRCIIFLAYPAALSGEVWRVTPEQVIDGYSGATPLGVAGSEVIRANVHQALEVFGTTDAGVTFANYSWENMFLGFIPGSVGETSALMCLLGAALLIITGVGSWRIMLAVVLGAVATAFGMNLLAPGAGHVMSLAPHWHLVMGGFAFGTVYMATDPVSAPTTLPAKWIFGLLIGALTVLIRAVNPGWPEGMMFAILLMNAFAPSLDYAVVRHHMKRRLRRA